MKADILRFNVKRKLYCSVVLWIATLALPSKSPAQPDPPKCSGEACDFVKREFGGRCNENTGVQVSIRNTGSRTISVTGIVQRTYKNGQFVGDLPNNFPQNATIAPNQSQPLGCTTGTQQNPFATFVYEYYWKGASFVTVGGGEKK